jgi:3-methyladenine DNA glycosylase AlkC
MKTNRNLQGSAPALPRMRRRVADYIDAAAVRNLALDIRRVHRGFGVRAVCDLLTPEFESLPLFARAALVADAIKANGGVSFTTLLRVLVDASGAPRAEPGYGPLENFRLLCLTRVVGRHGLAHFRESMWALLELTRRFTSEFDIRPFIQHFETDALGQLTQWTEHECMHVRRLASEGCRSRLPWATHIPRLNNDSSLALSIIERLRRDKARYVQISVANNLADIIKDDLSIGLGTAKRWASEREPATNRIVYHAIRYPASRGNRQALKLRHSLA